LLNEIRRSNGKFVEDLEKLAAGTRISHLMSAHH